MSRRCCLVLDDDRIAAAYLAELVAAQGLDVDHARTLREASQRLAQRRYDILLVDRRLPDGDGVRWARRVIADAAGGPTPRCLVTSGDVIDAGELPAGVGQLRKPVDGAQLGDWLASGRGATQGVPEDSGPNARPGEVQSDLLVDATALARFGGNRDALQSLRKMLRSELEDRGSWRSQLRQRPPPAAAIDALHRLRAACALTGCVRLGLASEALESILRRGSPIPAPMLDDFDAIVAATVASISG